MISNRLQFLIIEFISSSFSIKLISLSVSINFLLEAQKHNNNITSFIYCMTILSSNISISFPFIVS